jgi:hypothetical protein
LAGTLPVDVQSRKVVIAIQDADPAMLFVVAIAMDRSANVSLIPDFNDGALFNPYDASKPRSDATNRPFALGRLTALSRSGMRVR